MGIKHSFFDKIIKNFTFDESFSPETNKGEIFVISHNNKIITYADNISEYKTKMKKLFHIVKDSYADLLPLFNYEIHDNKDLENRVISFNILDRNSLSRIPRTKDFITVQKVATAY